jgi:hypothetical protein
VVIRLYLNILALTGPVDDGPTTKTVEFAYRFGRCCGAPFVLKASEVDVSQGRYLFRHPSIQWVYSRRIEQWMKTEALHSMAHKWRSGVARGDGDALSL